MSPKISKIKKFSSLRTPTYPKNFSPTKATTKNLLQLVMDKAVQISRRSQMSFLPNQQAKIS